MIIQILTDSVPFVVNSGIATKTESAAIPNIPETATSSICVCALGCEYIEPIFAKTSGEWWENDKSSFLLQKKIAADTITIKLYKAGVVVATIVDNTYGEYYSAFTAKPLYVGFVCYWENVFGLHGAGLYQIKADTVILGTSGTYESQKFRLLEYSDEKADGTVRIESYQTGNILSSQFDYTELLDNGWYQSFRIRGTMFSPDPTVETDYTLDENYEEVQVQVNIANEWTIETQQLPAVIANQINYDNISANKLLITDYNIYNYEIYRRKDLYVTDLEKKNEPSMNRERSWELKLADRVNNIRKRNW